MSGVCSDWTVKFKRVNSGTTGEDKFPASSRGEAIHAFKECYRHEKYEILEVVEGEPYKE